LFNVALASEIAAPSDKGSGSGGVSGSGGGGLGFEPFCEPLKQMNLNVPVKVGVAVSDDYFLGDELGVGSFCSVRAGTLKRTDPDR
jgi:hypothetical protein